MKDFFDEEYEKQQEQKRQQQEENSRQMTEWYTVATPPVNNQSQTNSTRHPLYIVLIVIALVLAIVLGWVLCAIFGGSSSQEEALLRTVMNYLENEYYQEITDAEMQQAVAAAGTAMLQSAGDRFCQLMSPQDFYDYYMQVDSSVSYTDENGYFGISFSHYGVGLYVSAVATDSSCYGLLQAGDIVVKFTQMKNSHGRPVSVDGVGEISELVIADYDLDLVDEILAKTHSANFIYLRDGELYNTGVLVRGNVGFAATDPKSNYKFVEYYFDNTNNNISTRNLNKAQHNTYELRGLSNLPSDTGYIRITQFMYYMDGKTEVTAYDEFLEVMQIFKQLKLKHLVLDLKGNPGGRVDVVCDIAGLLVTDAKLTADQQDKVTSGSKLKITSLVPRNQSKTENNYCTSRYDTYFDALGDTADIVIWTDGGSASASELLTGALTDYQTGFQIGTKTYGKGIAQRIVPLQNYTGRVTPVEGDDTTVYTWAIYYTFASYYSPLGTNIHGKGYTPSDGYNNIEVYGNKNNADTLWGATYNYWGLLG